MRIFISGGTGNIGQWVSRALLAAGHDLVLLTRTPDRIPAYKSLPRVTLVEGNILDLDIMEKALIGCDAVVHIALGWGNNPVEMLDHDTRVSLFLVDAAEKQGVKKFIYTSSTAAMGPLRDGMDERAQLLPGNLYGATKASTEMYLMGFDQYYSGQGLNGKKTHITRNVIRPGYTFSNPAFDDGASQSDRQFLNIAMAALKGEELKYDRLAGTQFLSARQIAELYAKLVESDLNKETFLALGTRFISWVDIARLTVELSQSSSKVIISDTDPARSPSYYSVRKMEKVFGLSFRGDEDLTEHVQWNISRARKILANESVSDPYHVW